MKKRIISLAAALCLLLTCLIAPLSVHADAISEMDTLIKNYPRTCSILLYTPEGGELYSYQPDKLILGASLIKLPYAVFACQQLTNGVHNLDETMTYTSSWYHGGSGIIRKNGYGKSYTIRQLLDYSLRYSDNVAYDMLLSLFGVDGFNSMVADWGFGIRIANPSPHFPEITAHFMERAMLEMQAHSADGECWSTCWDALVNSADVLTRSILSEESDVAVKYGLVQSVYHEVCYVAEDTPYVLVILSGAVNYTPDKTFVKNVAACAVKIVDEYEASTLNPGDFDSNDLNPGDLDGNDLVNAADAAMVLIAAANIGADSDSGLTEDQELSADVNADGEINASDAALILRYAAYVGAGETISFADFLITV